MEASEILAHELTMQLPTMTKISKNSRVFLTPGHPQKTKTSRMPTKTLQDKKMMKDIQVRTCKTLDPTRSAFHISMSPMKWLVTQA
jgi:hypothetical protein